MPYKSKAQMRWAFANKKEWAEKWAKETPNIKSLPDRKQMGGGYDPFGIFPMLTGKVRFNSNGNDENLPMEGLANDNSSLWSNPNEWQLPKNPYDNPINISGQTNYNASTDGGDLNNGRVPQTPEEDKNAIIPKKKGWDPTAFLRGSKMGLTWLSSKMERNRQDGYMDNQLSTLGQRNPIQSEDFQPNYYNLYARFGGKVSKQMGGETKDYYKQYMNSPMYSKMNQGEQDFSKERNDQLNKLTTQYVPESTIAKFSGKKAGNLGMYQAADDTVNINNKRMYQPMRPLIEAHEYSHGIDKGGQYMSQEDTQKLRGYNPQFEPSEGRALLNQTRWEAKKSGMYDPFTQPFKAEYLQDTKNNGIRNLKKQYTDEQILDLMNSVSKNEQSNIPIAQKGGRAPITVTDKNDPRLRAYNDSLNLYNDSRILNKKFLTDGLTRPEAHKISDLRNPTIDRLTKLNGEKPDYHLGQYKEYLDAPFLIPGGRVELYDTKPKQPYLYQPLQDKKPVQPVVYKKPEITRAEYGTPEYNKQTKEVSDITKWKKYTASELKEFLRKNPDKEGITTDMWVPVEPKDYPIVTRPKGQVRGTISGGEMSPDTTKSGASVFGPANSLIGYWKDGQFWPNDGAAGKVNQADLDLKNNPEALGKFLRGKGLPVKRIGGKINRK